MFDDFDYLPSGRSFQPIGTLRPHPNNPHNIDPRQLAWLMASIKADPEFMLRRPVLVSDGPVNKLARLIYAGHQRIEALKKLYATGWTSALWPAGHVPVDVQDVDERLALERLIRDNNHWADWVEERVAEQLRRLSEQGSDLTALGFVQEELDALLQSDGAVSVLSGQDGDRAENIDDRAEAYANSDVRKIELHYLASDFDQVNRVLDRLRRHYAVDNNAEAVLQLLRETHTAAAA